MSENTRDPRRLGARTWRPAVVVEPVAQVQDEAVRAVLLVRRRALKMELAEIERRCGLDPDAPDDPDDRAA